MHARVWKLQSSICHNDSLSSIILHCQYIDIDDTWPPSLEPDALQRTLYIKTGRNQFQRLQRGFDFSTSIVKPRLIRLSPWRRAIDRRNRDDIRVGSLAQ